MMTTSRYGDVRVGWKEKTLSGIYLIVETHVRRNSVARMMDVQRVQTQKA